MVQTIAHARSTSSSNLALQTRLIWCFNSLAQSPLVFPIVGLPLPSGMERTVIDVKSKEWNYAYGTKHTNVIFLKSFPSKVNDNVDVRPTLRPHYGKSGT